MLKLPAYAKGKPEGYLFPATYEIVPHETALGVLTGMVQRFDQEASMVNLTAAASKVHLTPGQVIIMASLVQAEGGRLSDYPKIARVIYNRLAQGIPLQLDSTVLYGLNSYGILASDQQLTSTSPYNTYKYKGLTPGPIDNPGNAAIQAVLHPASANWLYFVTVNPKTGETKFTASQAQFEQFRQELEKNLGQVTLPDSQRARRAAVPGSPVGHSLSPALHTAAYAALGLAGQGRWPAGGRGPARPGDRAAPVRLAGP